jgi:hypothetical protein
MQDAFLSEPYAAIVTTGDNFYKDDIAAVFAPFDWTRERDIKWWASWGNHDIANQARIAGVSAVLGETPNWTKFEWGVLDVIILDSNQIDNATQIDFLTEALDSSRPAIVVFHHPAFSCSKHGSTADVVESWLPLFVDDGDVLLVLNGHDHNYQHFEEAGIDYVVSGGGGRGLYNLTTCPKDHPDLIFGSKTHHFLRLVVDETGLTVIAIDATGTTFESFTIPVP